MHIVRRAAADASDPEVAACLPRLVDAIVAESGPDRLLASALRCGEAGLLEGATGIALALHTAGSGTLPASDWDACLLIN